MWSPQISIAMPQTPRSGLLLLAVSLAGFVGPAAPARSILQVATTPPPTTRPSEARYWLRVTADRVNLRSKGDLNSRIVGRVSRDDVLEAVGREYGWHQIVPPAGVFSLVSARYIERVGPGRGIAKVDTTLRVRVGSDIQPRDPFSSEVQTRLERDAEVQIVGALDDQWLKIVPPEGVYVYISAEFVERISREVADRLRAAKTSISPPRSVAATPPSTLPTVAEATTQPAEQPDLTGRWGRQLGQTLVAIATEKRKPEEQQAWEAIVGQLRPIADQRAEPQVARLAAAWIQKIDQHAKKLAAARAAAEAADQARRDKARYARELEEIRRAKDSLKTRPEFDARGVLRPSFALRAGPYGLRYQLEDPFTHEVQAYVEFPTELGIDIQACLGKYVGVCGEERSEEDVDVPLLHVSRLTVLNPEAPASGPARETP
jgi:hypothetical protein